MPISLSGKSECSGCAACVNKCPKQCIELAEDECGFRYPKVDQSKCINCELCVKVCPIRNHMKSEYTIQSVYAAWSLNPELREKSTSGGVFSELAYQFIADGGAVCGAEYDSDNMIRHSLVIASEGIAKLRQSKYAQSSIGEVFREIKETLRTRPVLFCGAPCQAAGLISFLGKRPENLFIIDFICRGVNSPKAYREWLKELEDLQNSKATRVWFKYKADGWKKSPKCTRIDFADQSHIVQRGEKNTFMLGYLRGNLYIRPSCGDCIFKGTERFGDITVGDFWGIDEKYDDDKGTSLVIVNSDSGKKLLESIHHKLFIIERNPDEIAAGNVCFAGSVKINPQSEMFLKELGNQIPFSKLIKKYTAEKISIKIKRRIKKILKIKK